MAAKKKVSVEGEAEGEGEGETPASGQSAAERASAEAQIDALVAKFAPDGAALVAEARRRLRDRLPSAHELVYEYREAFVVSYSPNDHGYEGALALRAGVNGLTLYFNRGKGLPDPARLLRGSGKLTRWIAVEDASALDRPEVAALIEAALAENPVPFALEGRGSVVVRSTTAKRRRETND